MTKKPKKLIKTTPTKGFHKKTKAKAKIGTTTTKKAPFMFLGETITNEGFLIKKNQHTPCGRQNWDHPTNEDIRDHHNNKKTLNTSWTPKPKQKFTQENTLWTTSTNKPHKGTTTIRHYNIKKTSIK